MQSLQSTQPLQSPPTYASGLDCIARWLYHAPAHRRTSWAREKPCCLLSPRQCKICHCQLRLPAPAPVRGCVAACSVLADTPGCAPPRVWNNRHSALLNAKMNRDRSQKVSLSFGLSGQQVIIHVSRNPHRCAPARACPCLPANAPNTPRPPSPYTPDPPARVATVAAMHACPAKGANTRGLLHFCTRWPDLLNACALMEQNGTCCVRCCPATRLAGGKILARTLRTRQQQWWLRQTPHGTARVIPRNVCARYIITHTCPRLSLPTQAAAPPRRAHAGCT